MPKIEESMHNVVVRVPATDLAKLHAIADDQKEPIAIVFRRWLRAAYLAKFGDAPPRAPTLKHGGKLRLPR